LRESLRLIRKRTSELRMRVGEKKERAQLRLHAALGDWYSQYKLDEINKFKEKHGIKVLDPKIYRERYSKLAETLRRMDERVGKITNLEEFLEKRGITLTNNQKEFLQILKDEVRRNPHTLEDILQAARYAHIGRYELAEAAKLLKGKGNVKDWKEYLKLAFFAREKFADDVYSAYWDARLKGLPWRAAGRFFGLSQEEESGELARKYAQVAHYLTGPKWGGARLHPKLMAAMLHPEHASELGELLSIIGSVSEGHTPLRDISEHVEKRTFAPRGHFHKMLVEELRGLVKEGPEMGYGRYHQQLEIAKGAQDLAERLINQRLSDVLNELEEELKKEDGARNNEKIKELIEKRDTHLREIAKEVAKYISERRNIQGGDDVVLERVKRIGRKIRERIWRRPEKGVAEEELAKTKEVPAKMAGLEETPAKAGPEEVRLIDILKEAHDHAAANVLPSEELKKFGIIIPETVHRALFEELRKRGLLTNSVRVEPEQRDELKKLIATVLVREIQKGVKLDSKLLKAIEDANIQEKYNKKRELLKKIEELKNKHDRISNGIKTKMGEIESLQYALTKLLGRGILNYSDERKFEQLLKTARRAVAQGRYKTIGEYFEAFYRKNGGKLHQNVYRTTIEQYLRRLKDAEAYIQDKEMERQKILQELEKHNNLLKEVEKEIEAARRPALQAKAAAIVKINRRVAQRLAEELIKAHKKGKFEFVGPKIKSVTSVKGQKW